MAAGPPTTETLACGSDLSEAAASALRLAAAWSRSTGMSLRVLHATPGPRQAAALHEALEGWCRASLDEPCAFEAVVASGEPRRLLEDEAGVGGWIALGCEGAGASFQRRAGRVTESLATSSTAPLLVAPPRWRPRPRRRASSRPDLSRVLVALSGGERDRARLEAACRIAVHPEGELALLRSLDLSGSRDLPAGQRERLRSEAEEGAREAASGLHDLVDDLLPEDQPTGLVPRVEVVVQGPTEADLAGWSDSQEMDFIVLGTGPIAARLAALTSRPLLVLP